MANTTADKLALAAANKAAIKTAILAKNPTTEPTDKMSDWAASIASIPTGGGWQKPTNWPDLHTILANAPTVAGRPNKIAVLLDKTMASAGYVVRSGESCYWFDGSTATTRNDIASERGATCWVVLYSSTAFTGRLVDFGSSIQFYNYKPILWVVGNNCAFNSTRQQNLCSCNLLECVEGINFAVDNRMTGNSYNCFTFCRSLQKIADCTIAVTEGASGTGYGELFGDCNSLVEITNITFSGVTNFKQMFYHCYALRKMKIENDTPCTFLQSFQQGNRIEYIDLPSTVTELQGYDFSSCTNLATLVCRATTPPTVAASNVFGMYAQCRIYVPYSADQSILNAYKAATNWSSRASYIYELNADGTIPEYA